MSTVLQKMSTRLFSFLFISFFAGAAFSQVVIESQDIPIEPGTVANYYAGSDQDGGIPVDLGEPGVNQVWDFSEGPDIDVVQDSLLDPDDTPFADDFPLANRVLPGSGFFGNDFGESYTYQRVNNSAWRILGIGLGDNDLIGEPAAIEIENPITLLSFPAEIGEEWDIDGFASYTMEVDTIPGIDEVRVEIHFNGSGEVDGWGTLLLPSGPVDVIRAHHVIEVVMDGVGIMYIFGIPVEIPLGELYRVDPTITYSWYSPEIGEVASVASVPGEEDPDFTGAAMVRRRILENQNQPLTIALQGNYFEMISSNLVPENLDAEAIFAPVENLTIVYQDNGSFYLPPVINTIGDISITEGYRIFCSDDSQLELTGEPVDPATVYQLQGNQWNWVGYPFQNPVPIETAMAEIENLVSIVVTDDGRFWIPPAINTIGDMQPGEGYLVFIDQDAQFTYQRDLLASYVPLDQPSMDWHMGESVHPTGLPYVILLSLDDDLASEAAYAQILDGKNPVGETVVDQPLSTLPVVAWKGAPEQGIEGFREGDEIMVRLYNTAGEEIPVEYSRDHFESSPFGLISVSREALPARFTVEEAYPNPFNPSVTIPFTLPKSGEVNITVFNVLGQQVFSRVQTLQAGTHSFLFDAADSDVKGTLGFSSSLVSGVYFLQIQFNGQVNTQKIILLK